MSKARTRWPSVGQAAVGRSPTSRKAHSPVYSHARPTLGYETGTSGRRSRRRHAARPWSMPTLRWSFNWRENSSVSPTAVNKNSGSLASTCTPNPLSTSSCMQQRTELDVQAATQSVARHRKRLASPMVSAQDEDDTTGDGLEVKFFQQRACEHKGELQSQFCHAADRADEWFNEREFSVCTTCA